MKKRSKCWNDFDELTKIVDGKKVRYAARCKHCKQTLTARFTSGTVVPMKDKFLKYWRDIPILYAVAFILDPRAKMRGFNKVLIKLSSLTGTDYSRLPFDVRTKLTKVFQLYETKFGDTRMRGAHQPSSHLSGKKKMACDDIYGDDDLDGEFSTPLGRRSGSSSTP